jgi:hypothetical protein
MSNNNFKNLLSSFISSIIYDGEISDAEPISYLSLDRVMNSLSLRKVALSFLKAKYLINVPRLDPSVPLIIQF